LLALDALDEKLKDNGAQWLAEPLAEPRAKLQAAWVGVDSATSPVNGAPAPEGPRPSLSLATVREHQAKCRDAINAVARGAPEDRATNVCLAMHELDALAWIKREPLAPSINGSALSHLTTAHELSEAGHHVAAAGELRHAVTEARAERRIDLPPNVDKVMRQIRTAAMQSTDGMRKTALFFLPHITTPELESLSPAQCVLVIESLAGSLAVIGGAK
jgi:hypothetical protein